MHYSGPRQKSVSTIRAYYSRGAMFSKKRSFSSKSPERCAQALKLSADNCACTEPVYGKNSAGTEPATWRQNRFVALIYSLQRRAHNGKKE